MYIHCRLKYKLRQNYLHISSSYQVGLVNTTGGKGRNSACNLHNKHVNKLLKDIIVNMGENMTDEASKIFAHSVSMLQAFRYDNQFDKCSGAPFTIPPHSTQSDAQDAKKLHVVHMWLTKEYGRWLRKESTSPSQEYAQTLSKHGNYRRHWSGLWRKRINLSTSEELYEMNTVTQNHVT